MDGAAGIEVAVGELVTLVNQTLDYAYPEVTVSGELANLRVSRGKWLYFDLKDDTASVKFFGTVYMLPGPLEDGMLLKVQATPHLHNLYGFSMNVRSIRPAGEGSIRKAADLLQRKLLAEGLFDDARKRPLPYPPRRIGLITAGQSAAYADFTKILDARWGGMQVVHGEVQVQGEPAVGQIVAAIEHFNALAEPPEVLVLIRGGGSPEDLAAFSSEPVVRAVAASRIPTLVAIGHEIDISLAELAADMRASTPSNAAELLVPDRQAELRAVRELRPVLRRSLDQLLRDRQQALARCSDLLHRSMTTMLETGNQSLLRRRQLLAAFDPHAALRRGYALLRTEQTLVRSIGQLMPGDIATVTLQDGEVDVLVQKTRKSST